MKKICIVLVILSLIGCSSKDQQTSKVSTPEKSDDMRVTLYSNDGKEIRRWTEVIEAEPGGNSPNLVFIKDKNHREFYAVGGVAVIEKPDALSLKVKHLKELENKVEELKKQK